MNLSSQDIINHQRQEIEKIDAQIFELVKKREALSAKIGKAKRDLHIPDRDFTREKRVFDRAIKTAQKLNLPENLVVNIQKLLITMSLSRQEKDRLKYTPLCSPKSVTIVGGAGRLGSWLARFCATMGHKICIVDKRESELVCPHKLNLDSSIIDQDIIIIATPIRVTSKILQELKKFDLSQAVVFDVSSVKTPIKQDLLALKAQKIQVTSLHPMFGPEIDLLFGKHIIRTSLGCPDADLCAQELFSSTSLKIIDMSIDQHDEIISYLLGLSHSISLLFVLCLKESSFAQEMLEKFSSPTFSHLFTLSKKVFNENPKLYFEIQSLNPRNQFIYEIMHQNLDLLKKSVKDLNENTFVALMQSGQTYLNSNQEKLT